MEGTKVLRFQDGARIVEQGAPGDCMYVIRSGKVRIFREDGRHTTLAILKSGEFFGEMSLFDNKPRSASAESVGEAEVSVITKADFDKLACDPLVGHLLTTMAGRLREIDDQLGKLSVESEQRREFVAGLPIRRDWAAV